MILGRVAGTIVATRKDPRLEGAKLLIVKPVSPDGKEEPNYLIAIDTVQAGPGALVLLVDVYKRQVMTRISHDTGGSDFDAQADDLRTSFREIAEQLRSSYELAYHATSGGDGTFHKLVIRTRQPGYTVRTKTGYFSRDGNH